MRLGWCGGGQPVGETQQRPFQLLFNSSLRVEFQGARVTSDGGLILVRELDERLGLSELMERHLTDSRRGKNTQLPLADLLRQSVYSRLAGYEDVNDAARLSQDPTFRLIGSRKIWGRGAALTSRLQSFETELLTEEANLAGLAALNRELVARAEAIDSARRIVLDMHSAEGWEELLLPEIERQQKLGKEVVFRADAAFAKPELYEALEERNVKYGIRLPANEKLERNIAQLVKRQSEG